MTAKELIETQLLALAVWREARGEVIEAKQGVAWSIRNRVEHPKWWGFDYLSVILDRFQYSSFNANDPNSLKWPNAADPSWIDSLQAATCIIGNKWLDNTNGSTHYFDKSLDGNPPNWAPKMQHTVNIGALRFYK